MFIKKLEETIECPLKSFSVVRYTCTKLLAIGENYGSTMYKVEVVLKNEGGEETILDLVAKVPPPKGFIWQLFTTHITFKKELGYYGVVAPTLQKFAKERNLPDFINSIPKYYGSRISLKPNSDFIDEDALLLLENLKTQGYEVGDRFTGFDLEASKSIINVMAKNHAIAIAFREEFPMEFNNKLLATACIKHKLEITEDYANKIVRSYIDFLKPFGVDFRMYHEKMAKNFIYRVTMHQKPTDDNIFNTISHNDIWTNNIMVKSVDNRVTDIKLVDYQVILYQAGTNDLIFFLYTSVQLPILKQHTDYLIQYYYDCFIETLTKTDTDICRFSQEAFDKTIQPESRRQFSHILKLLSPIFTKKGKAKNLENFTPEDFKPSLENAHENFAPRLEYIISEFVKRDWL